MKSVLYEKDYNRYLTSSPKLRLIPTTLIIGGKCSDGVVLVGDRKVTSGLGVSWSDKIIRTDRVGWAVFGAAGVGVLFQEFLTLLPQKVDRHMGWMNYQNQRLLNQYTQEFANNPNAIRPPTMTYLDEDFKQDCVELLTEMRNRYNIAFQDPSITLHVLIGISVRGQGGRLYYLDSMHCLPAEVNGLLAIGQSELAEVFRKSWDASMTMEQTAKLCMVTIKYIEQEGISEGIGVGSQQPQVWFLPYAGEPNIREILGEELNRMVSEVDTQVGALRTQLHRLFRA